MTNKFQSRMLKTQKTRNGVVLLWSLGVLALLVSSSRAVADDPQGAPPGLRVQNTGNSWGFSYARLRAIETAAGIKEGEYYRHSETIEGKAAPIYTYGCLGGKDNAPRPCATLKAILEAGKVDVFTYTHSNWQETEIAEEVAEFGLKHNPNFKLLWQAGWMVHDGLGIGKNGPDRDAVKIADLQAALDKARKPVEDKVDEINKKTRQAGRVPCSRRRCLCEAAGDGRRRQIPRGDEAVGTVQRRHAAPGPAGIAPARLLHFRRALSSVARRPECPARQDHHGPAERDSAADCLGDGLDVSLRRYRADAKNSLGMKLVYIPPGKFTMGSPETEAGRESAGNSARGGADQRLLHECLRGHGRTVQAVRCRYELSDRRRTGRQRRLGRERGGVARNEREVHLEVSGLQAKRRPSRGAGELERREGILPLVKRQREERVPVANRSPVGVRVPGGNENSLHVRK